MWAITEAGRAAWQGQDASIPTDYRRLLWLIDIQGGTKAIQSFLKVHPEQLIRDWLRELEELGFVRAAQGAAIDRTIPLHLSKLALAVGARAARELGDSGAYLAKANRARIAKPRSDTRILIVEDDPDQMALADLRVTMAGYQVSHAESVQQFMRSLLERGAPDLVLLDAMLPDGDGFDVLAKLRRNADYASLPVVLLTARNDPADIARGLALGADGYVTKPYSKNVLAGVIAGVLE